MSVTLPAINGGTTAGVLTTDASGNVSVAGNYSTSEVSTNTTWIDGKIIYKKTITAATLTSGSQTIAHGVSGFETLISLYGIITTNSGDQPVPRIVPDGVAAYSIGVGDVNTTSVRIIIGTAYTSRTNLRLTILYTKS